MLNAHILIDDNARHFGQFRGEGILFSIPHNKPVRGFHRIYNLLEIESILLLNGKFPQCIIVINCGTVPGFN
ncbi:hypothetical protein [Enterobacter sp. BWH52]|uniref:5' nucleotidase, NT5C type n=1 Tax=Enterobacter sp. BWH52 TaxID=1686386 RepID=UPI00094ABF6C